MDNDIEKIIKKNLTSKQVIDLAINMLDSTIVLYANDKTFAIYGLAEEGGLSTLKDNLVASRILCK